LVNFRQFPARSDLQLDLSKRLYPSKCRRQRFILPTPPKSRPLPGSEDTNTTIRITTREIFRWR